MLGAVVLFTLEVTTIIPPLSPNTKHRLALKFGKFGSEHSFTENPRKIKILQGCNRSEPYRGSFCVPHPEALDSIAQ